mgnify:CR=1 FL=1
MKRTCISAQSVSCWTLYSVLSELWLRIDSGDLSTQIESARLAKPDSEDRGEEPAAEQFDWQEHFPQSAEACDQASAALSQQRRRVWHTVNVERNEQQPSVVDDFACQQQQLSQRQENERAATHQR